MIVIMERNSNGAVERIKQIIEAEGLQAREIAGAEKIVINVVGKIPDKTSLELKLSSQERVEEVKLISSSYKLVSRDFQKEDTIIEVNGIPIGGGNAIVIAGPCAVESEEQAMTIARAVKKAGANIFRGGAYKPRTDPTSFQGLGELGLKILAKVREETGMPVVTEVMDTDTFDLVEEYADVLQIGTRNMQNFSLLRRAGKAKKPILLKRGMSATLDEWLMSAEYIAQGGNPQIILCERGIRTISTHSRNTLDLHVVMAAQSKTHLPIIVDPSHADGKRNRVSPLALAALTVGSHGLMIEVHHEPDKALCDGPQSLLPSQFEALMKKVPLAAELGEKDLVRSPYLQLAGQGS